MRLPIKLMGVYRVEENPDVSLLELSVKEDISKINLFEFTQKVENFPRSSWQVPFGEVYLDSTGQKVIGDEMNLPKVNSGNFRLLFFIYYLNLNKPLLTPFGELSLVGKMETPDRIKSLIKFINPE